MSDAADPVEICREVLLGALGGAVEVSTDLPMEHPRGPYVQLSRTGGEDSPFLLSPIVTLLVWGESDLEACRLATSCAHALSEAAKSHPRLSAAEATQVSRDEWAASGQSRYMVQLRLAVNA